MAWDSDYLVEGDATAKAECSASSEYSGTYIAENAYDAAAGGVDDCWISSDSNTPEEDGSCYLEWDFTDRTFISGVQIQRRSSAASEMTNYPKDIVVKAKKDEDVDWTTVAEATLSSPADGAWGDEVDFDPEYAGHYDALRIEFHSVHYRGTVGWNVTVREVRFHGAVSAGPLTVFYRGQVVNDINAEQTGTQNDYGYIGVTGAGESGVVFTFALSYREHDRYSDVADHRFTWDSESGCLKLEEYSYTNRSAGYLQAIFDPDDIDGLYVSCRYYHEDTAVADTYLRVTDGAFDYTSLVDYPQDAAPVTKGAGNLQTLLEQTASEGSVWKSCTTLLDLSSGTEADVTLRFEHLKNTDNQQTAQCYFYYLNICNLPVIDVARGDDSIPIGELVGVADVVEGDVDLPEFGLEGTTDGYHGTMVLPVPEPEGITNEGDSVLPLPVMYGEAVIYYLGDIDLPEIACSGYDGCWGDIEIGLVLSGASKVGRVATGNVKLPKIQMLGVDSGRGSAKLPGKPVGAGTAGILARGSVRIYPYGPRGTATVEKRFTGDANLPLITIDGDAVCAVVARGSARIPTALIAGGYAGVTAAGEIVAGILINSEGVIQCLTVGDVDLPEFILTGVITDSVPTPGLLQFYRGF